MESSVLDILLQAELWVVDRQQEVQRRSLTLMYALSPHFPPSLIAEKGRETKVDMNIA